MLKLQIYVHYILFSHALFSESDFQIQNYLFLLALIHVLLEANLSSQPLQI